MILITISGMKGLDVGAKIHTYTITKVIKGSSESSNAGAFIVEDEQGQKYLLPHIALSPQIIESSVGKKIGQLYKCPLPDPSF